MAGPNLNPGIVRPNISQFLVEAGSFQQLKANVNAEAEKPETGQIFREEFLRYAQNNQPLFDNSRSLKAIEDRVRHIDLIEKADPLDDAAAASIGFAGLVNSVKDIVGRFKEPRSRREFEEMVLYHPEQLVDLFRAQGGEFAQGKEFRLLLDFVQAECVDINVVLHPLRALISEDNVDNIIHALNDKKHADINAVILRELKKTGIDLYRIDTTSQSSKIFEEIAKHLDIKDLGALKVLSKTTSLSEAADQERCRRINAGLPLRDLGMSPEALEKFFKENGQHISRLNAKRIEKNFALKLIRYCPHLQHLSLRHCRIDHWYLVSHIQKLKNLETLDIGDNHIGDEGARLIGQLNNLKELNIDACCLGPNGAGAIRRLQGLSKLSISRNDIRAAGFEAISQLTLLKELCAHLCDISAITDEAVERLQSLQKLDISENEIGDAGAKRISRLVNLKTLDISQNTVGPEGAVAIGRMEGLLTLNISVNAIEDAGAASISILHNLEELHVAVCKIGPEGAAAIGQMENLRVLDITGNSIVLRDQEDHFLWTKMDLVPWAQEDHVLRDQGARNISQLPNLEALYIGGNSITREGAAAIGTMRSLKILDISCNNIGPAGADDICNLENLRELKITNNNLTNAASRSFRKLKNLEKLNISGNQLEHVAIDEMGHQENLKQLAISYNLIGNLGAEKISQLMPNLQYLRIRNGVLDVEALESISRMRNLKWLSVNFNPIGDEGARAISQSQSLERLIMENCGIRDDGAIALGTMKNLKELFLSFNLISDRGAEGFLHSHSLRRLPIVYTNTVSGLIKERLRRNSPLCNQY